MAEIELSVHFWQSLVDRMAYACKRCNNKSRPSSNNATKLKRPSIGMLLPKMLA